MSSNQYRESTLNTTPKYSEMVDLGQLWSTGMAENAQLSTLPLMRRIYQCLQSLCSPPTQKLANGEELFTLEALGEDVGLVDL